MKLASKSEKEYRDYINNVIRHLPLDGVVYAHFEGPGPQVRRVWSARVRAGALEVQTSPGTWATPVTVVGEDAGVIYEAPSRRQLRAI